MISPNINIADNYIIDKISVSTFSKHTQIQNDLLNNKNFSENL